MHRPEAVIFDIGNVLIQWQPEIFYDREIGPDARQHLFAEVDLHAMNERIDRGDDFRETVYGEADRHPKHADAIRLWHDRWIDIAAPAIDGTFALAKSLRNRGVPIFLLSNIGARTFAAARAAYPFLGAFDRTYLSGPMGVTKPDAGIYRMVEADCGLPAQALLFTDDRAENIDAAAGRGWQVHLFDGAEGLATRLADCGLLDRVDIDTGAV